jgi:hypothetical protein
MTAIFPTRFGPKVASKVAPENFPISLESASAHNRENRS